jgi:hypothetical protein
VGFDQAAELRGRASPYRRVCWQAPTRFEQATYDRSWAKKQNPVNKKARAGSMPAYAPTVKERKIVEKAAGFGLPHDKICQLIVSDSTTTRFTATTSPSMEEQSAHALV